MIQGWLTAFALWLLAATGPAQDAPRTTEAVNGSGLSVRLRVLPRASLASVDWLALEFENTTDEGMTVANAYYRLESERWDSKTGEERGSGGLGSGNSYDLFPQAWKRTPASPIVLLPKETYVVADQPSDYSSALLGLAPKDGWRIRARLHVNVDLKDGRRLETGVEGMPFEFDWLYPDDSGLAAMRDRLKSMLDRPEMRVGHSYLLGTLLGIEAVSGAVSRDDLLAALAKRSCSFDGRDAVAERVAERHRKDGVVIELVRKGLESDDPSTSLQLVNAGVWDESLLEPMVRLYESTAARREELLTRLHAHQADWMDGGTPTRLSAAVRKHHPILERNAFEVIDAGLEDWARGVHALGMTCDRSMIALLRPALDDRRAFRRAGWSAGPLEPPLRVCDCALDAILTLLDGDSHGAASKAMKDMTFRRDDADAWYAALRDKMIDDLRRRLAEGSSKRK